MKFATKIITASVLLFVLGCGQENPYIGVWESEPIVGGITEKLEFKKGSVAGLGKEVNASYKIENNKVGLVVKKDGNDFTQWFNVIDINTLEADNGLVKFIYHRKQ